jgi:hypothetical protein
MPFEIAGNDEEDEALAQALYAAGCAASAGPTRDRRLNK